MTANAPPNTTPVPPNLVTPKRIRRGFDTAAVDGNAPPDYDKTRAADYEFGYLKASQHVYPDTYYARDIDRLRKAGIVGGRYLFPGWGTTAAAAKAQVAVNKNAGDFIKGVDLPPALDVESGSSAIWTKTSKAFLLEQIRQLVFELQDQFGVAPVLYSSYMQWYDLGLPNAAWISTTIPWIKTAYRLAADQPVDHVEPPTIHFGPASWDPRDYHRAPDPWKAQGVRIRQIQGDALGLEGHNKTADINEFTCTLPGDTGPLVAWMQGKLAALSLDACKAIGNIDGGYGTLTRAALDAFKASRGLTQDGVLDVVTFAALCAV